METKTAITPADLRAAVARKRIPLFKIAARLGLHPSTLGRLVNGQLPLTEKQAVEILSAMAALASNDQAPLLVKPRIMAG